MEKLLSVIIPTYNMEALLGKGLKSLIIPDRLELLEVLIVNDGSKDQSAEIAQSFVNEFPTVFRLINKPNGNYGSCINAALRVAMGKYIRIMDADDYYDTKELEKLLSFLQANTVDIVVTPYNKLFSPTKTRREAFPTWQNGRIYNISNMPTPIPAMHSITYRTAMLKEHNYKQTEGISYTDQEWIFYPTAWFNTIGFCDAAVYQYILYREGQTMSYKVFSKKVHQLEHIVLKMCTYIQSTPTLDKDRRNIMLHLLLNQTRFIYKINFTAEDFHEASIAAIEDFWKTQDPQIYDMLGRQPIDKYIRIHCVRYWRWRKQPHPKAVRKLMRYLIKRFNRI